MSPYRTTIIAILLLSVLAVALSRPPDCRAGEATLRRQPVRLVEARQGDRRYWYDDRVPAAEARALLDYFSRNADDPLPSIYAVPGSKGYCIVSSWDSKSGSADFGRRLYLVRKTTAGYEEIDRTRGAADSYILRPVFFTGSGRVLILAEMGTEYSWGLMVYEIAQNRLKELGPLDAAVEGAEDAEDPTPFAAVKLVNGRWRVEFSHDLVLDPGGPSERKIERKGDRPIVFEQGDDRFFPAAGTFTAAAGQRKEHDRKMTEASPE